MSSKTSWGGPAGITVPFLVGLIGYNVSAKHFGCGSSGGTDLISPDIE